MPASVIGVPALPVLIISKAPEAFLTNQVQPEPKLPAALAVNYAWNSSKEPNAASIAAAKSPVGALLFGVKLFQ